MSLVQTRRPLVHWDRSVLRFDLDAVQQVVNQHLAARGIAVREVAVAADGDGVRLRASARLKGLPASVACRIADLRLYRRFVGCRVSWVRGPLGLPLALRLLAKLIDGLDDNRLRFDADDGILTYDLRPSLPPGLDLTVTEVRCEGRDVIVTLAGGSWRPTERDVLLPPDAGASSGAD